MTVSCSSFAVAALLAAGVGLAAETLPAKPDLTLATQLKWNAAVRELCQTAAAAP
jgi:hypothetical protein